MALANNDVLRSLAAKYLWWKPAEEALALPDRVIAQVMDIGDYNDVELLTRTVGEEILCRTLTNAEVGMFSERSWFYWHYRLGLSQLGTVPPMPQRKLA